jgi:uncharacterized protein (TIRG00374 family)
MAMAAEGKLGSPWRLVGLAAVVGLIILLFVYFVDLAAVRQQLSDADPGYLAAASLLLCVGLLAYAGRWRLLLANQPTWSHTFHASNVGHAGNILIPARAGEALRIVVMGGSSTVTVTTATSSFVVERLFEQLMRLAALLGAVIYGAGIAVSWRNALAGLAFVLLAFSAIVWLANHQETVLARGPAWLARLPRVSEAAARRSLADLLHNLAAISNPRQFALVLTWSLLTWLSFWAAFYLTLLALANGFPPEEQLAVSLGALALSPPSAPTQPGIFHASVVAPLAAVGYRAETLTAYAVVLHALEMIWMIGLALWGMARLRLSPRALWAQIAG